MPTVFDAVGFTPPGGDVSAEEVTCGPECRLYH